jgi:DNA-binding XRE family transcriptional regulator
MPRRSSPDDFWKHVAIGGPDDCWPWTAATDEHGYGRVRYQGRETHAHTRAWILTNGDPGELGVLHHCDNPPCCNLAHLFLGTQAANMRDMAAKGRHPRNESGYLPAGDDHHARRTPEVMARGERNGSARLTADQVIEIRRLRAEEHISLEGLARRFGVAKGTIGFITTGKTWRHLL